MVAIRMEVPVVKHRSLAWLFTLLVGLIATPAFAQGTVSTFSLDGLSYISFGNQQILLPDSGSSITFRFGVPNPDGSVAFTIEPGDIQIAPIDLGAGQGTLTYSITAPASGLMTPETDGRKITFTATVRASLQSPDSSGSYDYVMPFTTDATAATNVEGTETLAVSGLRLVEGVWYGQIVGATTNKANAFPEPGAAVYSVLSGSFDQVP